MPELGRYNRTDSLGLADGTNPYLYVSGSPLVYTDPTGLVKWTGNYTEGSAGWTAGWLRFLNVKVYHFTLEAMCEKGSKKIEVLALGPALILDKSIIDPFSVGGGKAEFEDNHEKPTPSAFNGLFGYTSFSTGLGVNYTFGSQIKLGNARGSANGIGFSSDFFSGEAGGGISKVIKESGDCCEQ